jgi:hypothetical protein
MFVGGTNQLTMKGSCNTLALITLPYHFHPFLFGLPLAAFSGLKHYFRIPTTRVREFVLAFLLEFFSKKLSKGV